MDFLLKFGKRVWWHFVFRWNLFFSRKNGNKLATKFTKMYWYLGNQTYQNTFWFGVPALKNPMDMWQYQEVLYATQPEVIVETGTWKGGSALFFAHLFDLLGRGEVLTVDIENRHKLTHPRVKFFPGSSTNPELFQEIKQRCKGKRVMVVLDSDHAMEHVLHELELYSSLVSEGCYLVVEDTLFDSKYVVTRGQAGPRQALRQWLRHNKDFVIDKNREKFMSTFYPDGWLLRRPVPRFTTPAQASWLAKN